MPWTIRALVVIAGNALALWIANLYVPGFVLNANTLQLILIAFVLSLLNFFLKPVLTLVLGPVIILTLGLGLIIVNAAILYLLPIIADHLDFLSGSITIQSIAALIWTTIIVSLINFVIHLAA